MADHFKFNMKSDFNTDGRTDGRYEDGPTVDSHLTAVDAGARIGESSAVTVAELLAGPEDSRPFAESEAEHLARLLSQRDERMSPSDEPIAHSIAWILDRWADRLDRGAGRRWPVIRSGDRDPIAWALRCSIYDRDGYTCKVCGWYNGERDSLELDHCIPWSAGGPDDSDNLRTLCSGCNQRRSNYIDDAHMTNLLPTTYWCIDCWTGETAKPRSPWRDGTYLDDIPHVASEERPMETVYCATCHYISQSDTYFTGSRGRALLAKVTRFVSPVVA